MAKPRDLFSGGSSDSTGGGALLAAHFAEDATSVNDLLMVTVDLFDPDITWGPAPWPTRVDDGGATVLPSKGNRCVVGLAESEIPGTAEVWVVAWTPG